YLGLANFVKLPVNGRQAGIEALVVGRIGGVADANQVAFCRKEAAAAAAINGLSRGSIVGLTFVLIDGGDLRRTDAGIGAFIAANGEDAVAGAYGVAGRRDVDCSDAGSADADERHVAIEVVADKLAID